MASKASKRTLALLGEFPYFSDWITNNLRPDQLIAVRDSERGAVDFGDGHPLSSQETGVELWRAYKSAVLFELKCRWPDENFSRPFDGIDHLSYFHSMVGIAVGLYVSEQPELLEATVERQRREIEAATGPARRPTGQPSTT